MGSIHRYLHLCHKKCIKAVHFIWLQRVQDQVAIKVTKVKGSHHEENNIIWNTNTLTSHLNIFNFPFFLKLSMSKDYPVSNLYGISLLGSFLSFFFWWRGQARNITVLSLFRLISQGVDLAGIIYSLKSSKTHVYLILYIIITIVLFFQII